MNRAKQITNLTVMTALLAAGGLMTGNHALAATDTPDTQSVLVVQPAEQTLGVTDKTQSLLAQLTAAIQAIVPEPVTTLISQPAAPMAPAAAAPAVDEAATQVAAAANVAADEPAPVAAGADIDLTDAEAHKIDGYDLKIDAKMAATTDGLAVSMTTQPKWQGGPEMQATGWSVKVGDKETKLFLGDKAGKVAVGDQVPVYSVVNGQPGELLGYAKVSRDDKGVTTTTMNLDYAKMGVDQVKVGDAVSLIPLDQTAAAKHAFDVAVTAPANVPAANPWVNGQFKNSGNTIDAKLSASETGVAVDMVVENEWSAGQQEPQGWSVKVGDKTVPLFIGDNYGHVQTGDQVPIYEVKWGDKGQLLGYAKVTTTATKGTQIQFNLDYAKLGVDGVAAGDEVSLVQTRGGLGSLSTTAQGQAQTQTPTPDQDAVDENGLVQGKEDADTTKGDQNQSHDAPGIKVDGNFDDWADVDKAETEKQGGYVGNVEYLNVKSDGDYAYIIGRKKEYAPATENGLFTLTVGDKKEQFMFDGVPSQGSMNVGDVVAVKMVTATEGSAKTGEDIGTAYIKLMKNSAGGTYYVTEYALNLKDLGISSAPGQTITIHNPNFGGTGTTAGGSSGPVLLASAGVLLAGLGYMKLKKRGQLTPVTVRTTGR